MKILARRLRFIWPTGQVATRSKFTQAAHITSRHLESSRPHYLHLQGQAQSQTRHNVLLLTKFVFSNNDTKTSDGIGLPDSVEGDSLTLV